MSSTLLFEQPRCQSASLILAVNDNPDFRKLLCAILKDDSFNVLTAGNGAEALDLVAGLHPDLIISDVVMPGIDGIELCRRLKADPVTSEIPVLLLTSLRYDEADIVEGFRAGAADYVPAYAPIELLRNKVEHLIAERKRIEEVRVESERDFRALIENSLDIVTILNADGNIRYESPSVETVLGYSQTDLIGRNAFELIHPDDFSSVINAFREGLHIENYSARLEFRFLHKDGSWRNLEAIGKNLLNEPRVKGIIVNSRDVTERKLEEVRVRMRDERYQMALAAVKEYAIFMLNPEGHVVSWNRGAEHIKGYKPDEIIGQHFSCFYTESDLSRDEPYNHLWAAMTESSFATEGWRVRKDGSRFWASIVLTALYDQHGTIDGFLKVTRDLTHRREREELLRRSEELLRSLLNNSPASIYIKDLEGRYILVNTQLEKLLGIADHEIIGKTDYDLFDDEIADEFEQHDRQVLESCQPIEVEESSVLNGERREYISTKFPLMDSNDIPYALCGISTDITAHKSLEDQLRHSQKMEAIGTLAGGIAHDFNNLLTVMVGYSELILRNVDLTDPLRKQVEEIAKAGTRASELTRRLLTFSRKDPAEHHPIELTSLIENLIEMLRRIIGEDIELVTNLAPALEIIRSDPGHIEQVIVNLAVNSRDAMPGGGKLMIETANVELGAEYASTRAGLTPGNYVMLAVSDTGCGMDKATQTRVFDPFFTTKPKGDGTGLGLSTVYGIVKQSGGHIWVESEPGNGSTFKIYFPVCAAMVAAPGL